MAWPRFDGNVGRCEPRSHARSRVVNRCRAPTTSPHPADVQHQREIGGTMKALTKFGVIAMALVLFAVSGWAQAVHDVTITGTVTAASGARLPGVTVTLISPALVTAERQVISDHEGRFVFLSLPPGSYKLAAKLQGFGKSMQQGIVLHSGENTDLKVTLKPAAFQEEMTVTAAAPVVDTKTSTVATTFTSELLEKLPTARNAFYDLAVS